MFAPQEVPSHISRASEAASKLPHVLRLAEQGTFDLPLLLAVRHLAEEYSSGLDSPDARKYATELEGIASELYKEIKGAASLEKMAFLGRRAGGVLDRMLNLLWRVREEACSVARTA